MTRLAIVGIDPSLTATGIATADGNTLTVKTNAKGMARLGLIRDVVRTHTEGADLIVIEGYSMASRHGSHQLGELGGVLRLMFHQSMTPYVEIPPTRLKKWATGKGNADKDAVLIRAAARWPQIANNNEADAAWLRDIAFTHYCGTPSKAHAEILAQVTWPELDNATEAQQ